jgi:hypothetical protein
VFCPASVGRLCTRSGNPGGAKQRQAGEEVEERHQTQYRTKGRARGDFTSDGSV